MWLMAPALAFATCVLKLGILGPTSRPGGRGKQQERPAVQRGRPAAQTPVRLPELGICSPFYGLIPPQVLLSLPWTNLAPSVFCPHLSRARVSSEPQSSMNGFVQSLGNHSGQGPSEPPALSLQCPMVSLWVLFGFLC